MPFSGLVIDNVQVSLAQQPLLPSRIFRMKPVDCFLVCSKWDMQRDISWPQPSTELWSQRPPMDGEVFSGSAQDLHC